jgi:hypothetical protein
MFDKTVQKLKDATDVNVAQPIRNIGMIAIAALIVGIVGIILAVRK